MNITQEELVRHLVEQQAKDKFHGNVQINFNNGTIKNINLNMTLTLEDILVNYKKELTSASK